MAGLYDGFQEEPRLVILTTDANQSMSEVHGHMPVVLGPGELERWIASYKGALGVLQAERLMLVKRPE